MACIGVVRASRRPVILSAAAGGVEGRALLRAGEEIRHRVN